MTNIIEPVPGDASTEPVATAAQSHVDGRVGPPTIAQDARATDHKPNGVEQIEPGTVLPADYPMLGGPLPEATAENSEVFEATKGEVKPLAAEAPKRSGSK